MFADLDETIRRLLSQQGGLNAGEVDIAFDMPTREWAAGVSKPTVNLYMYDIRENKELRDPNAWRVRRDNAGSATKFRPPLRVELSYMVTCWANAIDDEHRLLSRVLLALYQHQMLPEELLQGELAGQEVPTFTAQPDGLIKSPADYWGALDNDIKASFDYRATVTLDTNQEITTTLALTRRVRVGRKDAPDGPALEEIGVQIGGRIYRSGDPNEGVPGATVTLLERALDTTSDEDGRYWFSGVPPGQYTVVIAVAGEEEQRHEIDVTSESYDIAI